MSNKVAAKKKYIPGFFQRNKKWIYTGLFAGILILLLVINNRSLFGKGDNEVSISPNFNLAETNGKHLKLSDYKCKGISYNKYHIILSLSMLSK